MSKNDENSTLYEYLKYHDKYVNKYGKERVLVLMQIGSFYEAYNTGDRGPDLNILEDITDASIAHKGRDKTKINFNNPLMWGFPIVAKIKFVGVLIDNGYRLIIIDQVTPKPNIKREVVAIYSPATYLESNYKPKSNFIANIFIEEIVQQNGTNLACIGMSAIDISTGEVYLHESHSSQNDDELGLDETIRFLNGLVPKEIIIHTENLKKITEDYMIEYLDLNGKFFQFCAINKDHSKMNYQKKILEIVYPDRENMVSIIDTLGLGNKHYARKSLVYLLSYVSDHFESLIKGIKEPVFHLRDSKLILGNDAINQLDIVDKKLNADIPGTMKYHNLLDVVSKASTSMGKRFIKMTLISPYTDPIKLQKIYDIAEIMIENDYYKKPESYLKSIHDIERLYRKIELNMLHPIHMVDFINSFEIVLNMFSYCKTNSKLAKHIKTANIRKNIKFINLEKNVKL
jgi:DNA mismatch repair ATPase MutS